MASSVDTVATARAVAAVRSHRPNVVASTVVGTLGSRRVQAGLALVVVLASATAAHLWVTDATEAALASVQRQDERRTTVEVETAVVQADLRQAGEALTAARTRLADVRTDERTIAAEATALARQRDVMLIALGANESDLRGAADSLHATGARARVGAAQITELRACLTGVNQALTFTTFDDRAGALRALSAVAASCDAAGAPR